MKWRPDPVPLPVDKPRFDGLDEVEGRCLDALVEAIGWFDNLEEQHPNDTHEFYSAIHIAQDLLAVRIARRLYPEGWPTHKPEQRDPRWDMEMSRLTAEESRRLEEKRGDG